jgi:hypothetical protein
MNWITISAFITASVIYGLGLLMVKDALNEFNIIDKKIDKKIESLNKDFKIEISHMYRELNKIATQNEELKEEKFLPKELHEKNIHQLSQDFQELVRGLRMKNTDIKNSPKNEGSLKSLVKDIKQISSLASSLNNKYRDENRYKILNEELKKENKKHEYEDKYL